MDTGAWRWETRGGEKVYRQRVGRVDEAWARVEEKGLGSGLVSVSGDTIERCWMPRIEGGAGGSGAGVVKAWCRFVPEGLEVALGGIVE